MFEIGLHQDADEDLKEAAVFYEVREPGLGELFLDEVDLALKRIQEYPSIGKRITAEHRSYSIRRFPFRAVYRIEENAVLVLAIAHSSRRPGSWRSRK
jgi:plasmid stabilization system protein ParE